jgi:predicted secreted hydrolase
LDLGPHPDFQTEWWYYTGNLAAADGRAFGYQLTFFRRAILPARDLPARTSEWATGQIYFAHFTLTNGPAGSFRYFERFERGAAGLAGASGEPLYQVWLQDWSVRQTDANHYRLHAAAEDIQIKLDLVDRKGPVLQGDRGLSQKGPQPGNASYYISQTRLESQGSIQVGDQTVSVSGLSWMDHEFSTSSLSGEQVGWDWYALQLSDGSELMVYQMRKTDGTMDPFSQGTLIYPDGRTRFLQRDELQIQVLSTWKSPHSGASYPAEWTVAVPSEQLSLRVTPRLADQELRVSFTYWEGAVTVTGSRLGKDVSGSGYVELTGYARSMQGQF